jgi:glycosyltransferase involved in cell wall biosynthesis
LAAAIKRALNDDDLTERLRANGSLRALDFSMSTLVDHYIRIYRALIA